MTYDCRYIPKHVLKSYDNCKMVSPVVSLSPTAKIVPCKSALRCTFILALLVRNDCSVFVTSRNTKTAEKETFVILDPSKTKMSRLQKAQAGPKCLVSARSIQLILIKTSTACFFKASLNYPTIAR